MMAVGSPGQARQPEAYIPAILVPAEGASIGPSALADSSESVTVLVTMMAAVGSSGQAPIFGPDSIMESTGSESAAGHARRHRSQPSSP